MTKFFLSPSRRAQITLRGSLRRAQVKAGLQGLVFHGLRKTATGNLAEAGCTSEQIKAITGHKTDRMVSHYVAGAKQKERAKAAMKKLEAINRS